MRATSADSLRTPRSPRTVRSSAVLAAALLGGAGVGIAPSAASASATAAATGHGATDAAVASLALDRSPQGHLIVAGTLNGEPARWIVDTAATGSALAARAVAAHGLVPVPDAAKTVHAAGGSLRVPVYRVASAGAGGRELRDFRTVALPAGVDVGTDVDGILGADWLRLGLPEFDFERGTLTLHARHAVAEVRERLRAEGFVPVSFRTDRHGLLVLRVGLGAGAAFAVLDTGADRTLVNWAAAGLAGLAPGDARLRPADRVGGATGHVTDAQAAALGPLRALDVDDRATAVAWPSFEALVADLPVHAALQGADVPTVTLGMDLLGAKRGLVIDFTGHRLWIR